MDEHILDLVRGYFSAPSAVEEYQGRAARGLLAWEQHVAAHSLTPPGKLLDIGCGGGREAIALHDLGHRVTGIDISPQQVEAARGNARQLGKNIEFRVCDGKDLPFAAGSFQYVVIWAQAFGNISGRDNRLHLLQECARVLAPSGIISVSAHNRDTCEPVARSKGLICHPGDVVLEDGDFIIRDGPQSEARCFYHYFGRDELMGLCQTSGLRTLTCALAADLGQTGWDTVWVVVAESPEGARGERAHGDPPCESRTEKAGRTAKSEDAPGRVQEGRCRARGGRRKPRGPAWRPAGRQGPAASGEGSGGLFHLI